MKLARFLFLVGAFTYGYLHPDFVVQHIGEIIMISGLLIAACHILALWFRIRMLAALKG